MLTEETEKIVETVSFNPICPFHIRKPGLFKEPETLRLVERISDQVEINKETLQVRPVLEKVDLHAETQTYKDQCGLDYFLTLVSQGKAKPEDAYDDGKHGLDTRQLPETIHDAHAQSEALSESIAEMAKAAGLKDGKSLSSDDLIELIVSQVKAKIAEQPAPEAPKE